MRNNDAGFKMREDYIMENKAFWSVGRLVLGIFAIVLFALVAFQSCAVGVGNALEESDSVSGSSGLLLAVFMLVGGIVSVATRKSNNKGGLIACAILFAIAAFMGATSWGSDYSDLDIWTIVCVIYTAFYIFCTVKTKKADKVKSVETE